jgi:protein-tyrosine phosphatase
MIDLHCHILPGIDDGASDLSVSLEMARAFVADGVTVVACTPHILPGLYPNSGPKIRDATAKLQQALDDQGITLTLVTGADNHVVQGFVTGLRSGHLLTLRDSRYVLVEPPHLVAPVRIDDLFFELLAAGFVPILTHPERLSWIDADYARIERLRAAGVWMQITAGSLAGNFGRRPRYWAERMLDEGAVHILATDAHDASRRRPNLSEGRDLAAKRIGADGAEHLVLTRPMAILNGDAPSSLAPPEPGLVLSGVADEHVASRAKRGGASAVGLVRGVTDRLRRLVER